MNMKNKNELPKLGKKRTVAGLVLSFVAMITLVGAYTFSQYQGNVENELAELELIEEQESLLEDSLLEESLLEAAEEANTSQIVNESTTIEMNEETSGMVTSDELTSGAVDEVAIADESTDISTTNASVAEQAAFTESSQMVWPVNGGIIMMYNMDTAVYFATLDQYKLNPAMIIEGTVGTEVLAGERGTVISITNEADTGNTVMIDMGNGYTAVYGQLDELKISEGGYVEKGQVIGTLAEPTKYYSVEGCNLYFQVLKDEEPTDPLVYLTQ